MANLSFLPAHEMAGLIRSRQLSAKELLEAHLRHIARHNPALNAIVTLDEEGARRRAREADETVDRGEIWGPLHGVPVTIKDCYETAGMRTTSGFPRLKGHVPDEDATVVARLRAAGAVIMGKTNLPLLATDWQTENPVFGRTNNPWDVSRTCGGSSGGSAAAVAAGYAIAYTTPFQREWSPGCRAPAGRSKEGLPVGIQIVGHRWKDEQLLAVAATLDERISGFAPPPGYETT